MRVWGRTILSAAIIALSASIAGAAVMSGQTDDFQDGTVANWTNGGAASAPTNVANGGPLGLGDKYMHVVSGSNLATFNTTQWIGNFSAANVLDIALDLRNPNLTELDMRVVIHGPSGSRWTSAVPAVVPADNLWHHYVKSLRQTDLMNVVGGDTYAGTITDVSRMQIRHEVTPGSGGTPFTGAVDIDNVSSVVPEPATLAPLGALAVSLACRRRRWRWPPFLQSDSAHALPSLKRMRSHGCLR